MAAVTSIGETPASTAASRPRGMHAGRKRRLNAFRYVVFTIFGLFFLLPLLAMVRFSLEGAKLGTWSVTAWKQIASYQGEGVPPLLSSIEITLELAVITSVVTLVLLVPTMIWVRLRVQWLSRTVEFLSLLPLTIPAIVLVVGLGPIYNQIQHYSLSALMLFWVYVILALPYAYRALAAGLSAIDVPTLSEAARSLGASWFTKLSTRSCAWASCGTSRRRPATTTSAVRAAAAGSRTSRRRCAGSGSCGSPASTGDTQNNSSSTMNGRRRTSCRYRDGPIDLDRKERRPRRCCLCESSWHSATSRCSRAHRE